MNANSKHTIVASFVVIFCLVGPLTFWLGERSSQASLSCAPKQHHTNSPVVFSPSNQP